jgi:peptidylprolyl isomerase
MLRTLALTLLGTTLLATAAFAQAPDKANLIYMDTTKGRVMIELKPNLAPNHVERIKTLTRQGFYDGIVFHRVIEGFMAQTGDPTGTGTGGSTLPDLKAEFSNANFGRGTLGMARANDPNSANSQFFICFEDCAFLNGQYTIFGQVIDGMSNVDKINRGEPPSTPDKIIKMQIATDVKEAQ